MTKTSSRAATLLGLGIALLGGPAIIALQIALFGPIKDVPSTLLREGSLWLLAGLLILIIIRGERLSLASIGLRAGKPGRTALLTLGLLVALAVASAAALAALYFVGLPMMKFPGFMPPPLILTLVIVRAGVVEELFYRGYAIERLEALTGSRWVAAILPTLLFAAAHFKGGVPGMFIALVLGSVLAAFYMWKRNLAANIAAHFLIDMIPNVLLPLFGA